MCRRCITPTLEIAMRGAQTNCLQSSANDENVDEIDMNYLPSVI
jgi:hypothetical protein